MKLPTKIKFSNKNTRNLFLKLKEGTDEEKNLFNSINNALRNIEENAFTGIQIPKRLIPKEYKKKQNINNLWKCNLPNSYRLLYSIENNEIIVVSIILEWLNHKSYEKKFKY